MHTKPNRIFIFGFLVLTLGACSALRDQNELAAKPVATAFLSTLDSGDVTKTHDQLSKRVQSYVTRADVEKWVKERFAFGPVVSRQLTANRLTNQVRNAPDGTYEILQYHTAYSNKQNGWEEVVVAKEGDIWRVSGYHFH